MLVARPGNHSMSSINIDPNTPAVGPRVYYVRFGFRAVADDVPADDTCRLARPQISTRAVHAMKVVAMSERLSRRGWFRHGPTTRDTRDHETFSLLALARAGALEARRKPDRDVSATGPARS
jgi:hypothetical protein